MSFSFKSFLERREPPKKLGYQSTISKEIGADQLPITIARPIELEYDGFPIVFNQIVLIPLSNDEKDKYVQLQYFNANQSNKNFSRGYIKMKNGELRPYQGIIPDGHIFTVPRSKVSELDGAPFADAIKSAGSPAAPGGV
jgi:hypothetical protein